MLRLALCGTVLAAAVLSESCLAGTQNAGLLVVQPRVGAREYAGIKTVVTLFVPSGGGGGALVDTEAINIGFNLIDSTGNVLFGPFGLNTVGGPVAYNGSAGNTLRVDLGTINFHAPLANASVIGLQFQANTTTGNGFLVAAFAPSDESVDEVCDKDRTPPTLVDAYRPDPGDKLYLVFSEPLNNGGAANNDNQTVLANISAADLQFNTSATFTGNEAAPVGLSNPAFAFASRTALVFDVVGSDAAVGNYIRPSYNAVPGSQNDIYDLAHNVASDTARVITATPTQPTCPADISGDGAVTSADLALLLGAWGDAGGPADITGDGVVNSADLSQLLGAWGPCK